MHDTEAERAPARPGSRYEIVVEGVLDERWSSWFDGLRISNDGNITAMAGSLPDQAALHGLLVKIQDLGLSLISIRREDVP